MPKKQNNNCSIPYEYIVEDLLRGSGFVDGKKRIYNMYQTIATPKERISALKKEYGTGGYGRPLDGYGLHGAWHDAKGISLQWRDQNGEHEGTLSWAQVEKHLGILIKNGDYYCPAMVVKDAAAAWSSMFDNIPAELVS